MFCFEGGNKISSKQWNYTNLLKQHYLSKSVKTYLQIYKPQLYSKNAKILK